MLPKFTARGLFKISKFQCGVTKKEDVYKKLVKKEAEYHEKCYTQYDQDYFDQLPLPPMEKSSESEEFGPTSSKSGPNVIRYPLLKWCALFGTNQTPIFVQQE